MRPRLPRRWERVPGWLIGWTGLLGGIVEALWRHQTRSV